VLANEEESIHAKDRCGSLRLVLDLADQVQALDRKTVVKSLQRQGLRAKAPAEGFFQTQTIERIHGERFGTGSEMRTAVFEYI